VIMGRERVGVRINRTLQRTGVYSLINKRKGDTRVF